MHLPADIEQDRVSFDDSAMLVPVNGQGADASVSVHFSPDGGPYPREAEVDEPTGYAFVHFTTSSHVDCSYHEQIVNRLGQWLAKHGRHWSWTYEDNQWASGDSTFRCK